MQKRVVLLVLDGYGLRRSNKLNAVLGAKTPNLNYVFSEFPFTTLKADNGAVGLPRGFFGNSEVGHIHLGSCRKVDQELTQINKSINDKTFFQNKYLILALEKAIKNKSSLHIVGMLSSAGVHSETKHLLALLELCKLRKFKQPVFIHAITDGRDSGKTHAIKELQTVVSKIKDNISIATIIGRYYAMDRNNNWDRTKIAHDFLTNPRKDIETKPLLALRKAYKNGKTDEFMTPIACSNNYIQDEDSVIFFNYREDRARQLTQALIDKSFSKFKRKNAPKICMIAFNKYYSRMPCKIAFPQPEINNGVAEIVSKANLRQFRIAETEKYAHVTYFFSGGCEKALPKEDRFLVPSPNVTTYDKTPKMSAQQITSKLIIAINGKKYALLVANFANSDMVGHTGNYKAAIKAIEFIDECIGKIISSAIKTKTTLCITADHGNSEDMVGKFATTHTSNPVPFCLIDENYKETKLQTGEIHQVGPTLLKLLDIKRKKWMSKPLF